MSREYRGLARTLRPVELVPHRRRSVPARLVGWVFRHAPELLVLLVLIRAGQTLTGRIGTAWTVAVFVGLAVVLAGWGRSRRWLLAMAGCVLTQARLRAAFAELRLTRRSGRLPFTVAVLPTAVGERVWLVCPLGVCAEDIADEADRLRAACFARDVRVTRDRRWSALVRVDVIRRDTLAARNRVRSPLADPTEAQPGGGHGA